MSHNLWRRIILDIWMKNEELIQRDSHFYLSMRTVLIMSIWKNFMNNTKNYSRRIQMLVWLWSCQKPLMIRNILLHMMPITKFSVFGQVQNQTYHVNLSYPSSNLNWDHVYIWEVISSILASQFVPHLFQRHSVMHQTWIWLLSMDSSRECLMMLPSVVKRYFIVTCTLISI